MPLGACRSDGFGLTRGMDAWKCAATGFAQHRGMVERKTTSKGKTTLEQRYFTNSFAANAKTFAHAVRSHWGIENSLHWRLDVVIIQNTNQSKI